MKRRLGLRLQILIALGLVLLVSYVPLFFAISNVTRATLVAAHDRETTSEPAPKNTPTKSIYAQNDRDAAALSLLRRGVALYMALFALALLTFAYFGLTYLIVKPIDALILSADKVARGARELAVPTSGASEVAELGARLQTMTARLVRDEMAMREKVDELTRATTQLSSTQSQLIRSERLASVGHLAAGIAHEIGNPLAAIIGMHDLMDEGLSSEEKADFLRRMRKETERINTVVRSLLDFARAEKHEVGEPVQPADVGTAIDDVFSLVRPQKHFKSITLRKEIAEAEGAIWVPLSDAQITQVLLNLLLNAGASIARAHESSGSIVVRVLSEGEKVRLEIEDNGSGVAGEIQRTLFEPFVTTKEVGEGTGLGLSVCRGLVEGAGGELFLDPSFTAGARFVIHLPRTTP